MPLPKHVYTAEDYWNLPDGVRAELIDGELWGLASPSRKHQEIVMEVSSGLKSFIESHGGSRKVYPAPFAINLFDDDSTFVEPDVTVICDCSKLSDRGCEGAPDLAVEVISPSSREMDYLSKLNLYREAGVLEYWICDPLRERTLVYSFVEEEPRSIYPFAEPVVSALFPGFSIDLSGVVAGM